MILGFPNIYLQIFLISFVFCQMDSQLDNKIKCSSKFDSSINKLVYTELDQVPSYPGGKPAFIRFFIKEFKYPNQQDELQSTTKAKFVVDVDGNLYNIRISKPINGDTISLFEREYLRVLRLMPKWLPGKCNGKVVAAEVNFPIEVLLELDN